jgi:exopolysaccharide biosynthesis polyprenyl glycosylphosphotransferase
MLRPINRFPKGFQIGLDILGITLAYYCAIKIRLLLNPIFSRQFSPHNIYRLMPPNYLCIIILLIVFNYFNIYEFYRRENIFDIFLSVFKCISLGTVILLSITFLFKAEGFSRSLVLIFWGTSIIVLTMGHFLSAYVLNLLRLKNIGIEKIAIVGINETTVKIAERIKKYNKNCRFEGYIQAKGLDEKQINPQVKSEILGKLDSLVGIINKLLINRILVSDLSLTRQELSYLIRICEKMDVHLDRIPDLLTLTSKKVIISEVDGMMLIGIRQNKFTRTGQVIKRIADLILATMTILLLLPLLLIIVLLIKIDSKGSLIFTQKRVGKGGKYFIFYKFRSMNAEAEIKQEELSHQSVADGCLFKIKNDPRITRVGKYIRKFSIDELPQLINVLKGEMSFVGPRPLPSSDMEKGLVNFEYQLWAEKRAEILPGLTGLWQIQGRSDLNFEDMMNLDIYYLNNWSLWLDIKILIKTIPVVFLGKGSY